MQRTLGRLATAGAMLLIGATAALAQSSVRVSAGDYVGAPGGSVTIPFEVTSDVAVTGFSFGVTHAAELSLESVTRSAEFDAILGAGGPDEDFYLVDTEVDGGEGFVVAVVLPPGDAAAVLPAGDTPVFAARYGVAEDSIGTTSVTIVGGLSVQAGAPPVDLIVDVGNGQEARAFDGSSVDIRIVEGFVRGDADLDGRLTITDTVRILGFLFQGDQRSDECLVTLNYDASTGRGNPDVEDIADIQIDDAIRVVDFLFRRSMRPPEHPYPDCGQSLNELAEELACSRSNCQ